MISDKQNRDDPLATPNPVYETVPRATEIIPVSALPDRKVYVSTSDTVQSSPPMQPVQVTSAPSSMDASNDARKLSTEISNAIDNVASTPGVQSEQQMKFNSGIDQEHEIESILHGKVKPTMSAPSHNMPIESADEPVDGSQTVMWPVRRYSYGLRTNGVSEPAEEVHSYYYYTIVAAIVVGLCFNFVVLLACFLPALWFANKASVKKLMTLYYNYNSPNNK